MSVQRPPSSAENEERTKGLLEQIEFLRQRVLVLEKSESERCQVDREVHRLAEENEIIAEIGRIITSSLYIKEVYNQFAKVANRLLPFDRIAVYLIHPDAETITVTYIWGMEIEGLRVGQTIPLKSSMMDIILHIHKGVLIHQETDEDLAARYPFVQLSFQTGLRSMLSVSLIYRDQMIGALHFRSKKSLAYTEQNFRLAERIAVQIAGAVANAQLFAQCKRMEETLKKRSQELKLKSQSFKEVNTALKVMLQQREDGIVEVGKKALTNVQELVWPYLEKLKNTRLSSIQSNYVNIATKNLTSVQESARFSTVADSDL